MQPYIDLCVHYWLAFKMWLSPHVGLTNDAIHLHVGFLILFGSAFLLRRPPYSIWCWLIIFMAECVNESIDYIYRTPGEDSVNAGLHDLANTMFWPTMILLFGRLFVRWTNRVKAKSSDLAD